jgi:hypothetical protein
MWAVTATRAELVSDLGELAQNAELVSPSRHSRPSTARRRRQHLDAIVSQLRHHIACIRS